MKSAASCYLVIALAALPGCRDRDKSGESSSKEPPKDYPSLGERLKSPNDQDRAGTTTLTSGSWMANQVAVDRLTAARCAREVACSNVGPDKHFANDETCWRDVRKKVTEDIKPVDCPNGIDGKEVDSCIEAIRTESCTNPIDTMSRMAACQTSKLCLKIAVPHR